MPERATVFETTQIGVESTSGTLVPANKRLLCTFITPDPDIPRNPYRPVGSKSVTQVVHAKEMTEAEVSGVLCYNDLVYLLSSLLDTAVISTPSGATSTRRWVFTPANFDADALKTFSVEVGSPTAGAERFTYGLLNGLTQRWTEDEASVAGTMVGQELAENITMTGSPTDVAAVPINMNALSLFLGDSFNTNEVQSVTIGTNTAGQFTLTFVGLDGTSDTTADIQFDANAATVQAALEALSTIGTGQVSVSGASSPWTVTFQGLLAGINVNEMTLADGTTALSGGTGQGVSTTTLGGLTRLSKPVEFEIAITDRVTPVKTLDATEPSFTYHVEKAPEASISLVMQHDATSRALVANLKAGDTNFLKALCIGPAIDGGYFHWLDYTMPVKLINVDYSDQDDVWSATYEGRLAYDTTFGTWIIATIQNTQTAL